jgi:lysophospholipase L1-like esterase
MNLRWSRVVCLLLVSFAMAEGAARLYVWFWTGKEYRSTALYLWSPYGLVRNNPDVTSPTFQIDRAGFRNLEEFDRKKPPNTYRVILLGGSVLYAGLSNLYLREEGRVGSDATIAQYLQRIIAADPAMNGVRVEVINAAVNYNRIVETSAAYLAEYAYWDPDLVLVFGSANNFMGMPTSEEIRSNKHNIQGDHPWKKEFERQVNQRNFASLAENAVLMAGDNMASVAMMHKLLGKLVDSALALANRHSMLTPSRAQASSPATIQDEERYFAAYAAYADALVAAARRHGQDIAFFWEYWLGDMGGVKPLSERERWLYEQVRRGPEQTAYTTRMRDRWVRNFEEEGVPYVDPIDVLRASDQTLFIDYLHYTRRGNDVMARATYDSLRPLIEARIRTSRMARDSN